MHGVQENAISFTHAHKITVDSTTGKRSTSRCLDGIIVALPTAAFIDEIDTYDAKDKTCDEKDGAMWLGLYISE